MSTFGRSIFEYIWEDRLSRWLPLRRAPPIRTGLRYGAMVVVGKVYTGSPAASAGLVEEDVVVELGGQSGSGYVDIATSLVPIIVGSEGTALDATVIRVRGCATQVHGCTGAFAIEHAGGYTGGHGVRRVGVVVRWVGAVVIATVSPELPVRSA